MTAPILDGFQVLHLFGPTPVVTEDDVRQEFDIQRWRGRSCSMRQIWIDLMRRGRPGKTVRKFAAGIRPAAFRGLSVDAAALDQVDAHDAVAAIRRRLKPADWRLLYERFYQRRSTLEIADRLGVTESRVSQRIVAITARCRSVLCPEILGCQFSMEACA